MNVDSMRKRTRRSAFTLIELLVLIGVIAVLAGAVGVGLAGGNQATSLASAREILRTHLVAARQQAALDQAETALLFAADATDPERYLKYIAIARRVPETGEWRVDNRGATLPGEAWILPPSSGSSLLSESVSISIDPGSPITSCYMLRFGADGKIVGGSVGELWVGLGQQTEAGIVFPADAPKLGLSMSRYGAISTFSDADASTP
jgi:type II secretory pathway pseudopilin PulG